MRSPRTSHALAQLQARKRVVVKGEVVSYPPFVVAPPAQFLKATPSKAVASKAAPAQKASGATAPPEKPVTKKSAVPRRPSRPAQRLARSLQRLRILLLQRRWRGLCLASLRR